MKAIMVKYLPPTAVKGARMKAYAEGVRAIIEGYDYEDEETQALRLARQLAERQRWGKLHPVAGWTGREYVFVFACDGKNREAVQQPNGPEGTTEFIGPPRRVWCWTKNNDGLDPRCMTGYHSIREMREGFPKWDADALDAPTRMAAGSTAGRSDSWEDYDPDRSVFPTTFNRDWM